VPWPRWPPPVFSPDNATGNFTKIVQRLPVKNTLDDNRLEELLRAGTSVEPSVDTKATAVTERDHVRLDDADARAPSRIASPPAN
jgi:multidrug resistance efflux pump